MLNTSSHATSLDQIDPKTASYGQLQAVVKAVGMQHIAIIMDGNRRWAKKRFLPTLAGHMQGVEALKTIVRYASDLGISTLTVYAFSTENWKRGEEEVSGLLKLFLQALQRELNTLHAEGVRLRFIGDLTPFPAELRALLEAAMTQTAQNQKICLQVAINYGSRAELTAAARHLAQAVAAGALLPEEITEAHLDQTLYSATSPELDLLIRTGGESRLSNFLLWQAAYAEFYVTEALWPAFDRIELNRALLTYAQRERRFGQ